MKIVLLLTCLSIFYSGLAQCPYHVALSSSGKLCVGTTLKVNSSHAFSSIIWYNGPLAIDTVLGTDGLSDLFVTVAGDGGPGDPVNQLLSCEDLFVDEAGNIFVSDEGGECVKKWAPGATDPIIVAGGHGLGHGPDQINSPTGIFVDHAGNVYVSDMGNSRVQKWAPGATQGVTVAGGNGPGANPNQLTQPNGIYVDCDGNIYIADLVIHRVQKWAPGAIQGVTVAGGNGPGPNPNQLYNPTAVWLDGNGNIYVSDAGNNRVQKWVPGAVSGVTVAGGHGMGSNPDQLAGPQFIYVDAIGNIYIADLPNRRVQKWAPGASKGVTLVEAAVNEEQAGNDEPLTTAVFPDARGNLFLGESYLKTVQEFKRRVTIDTGYTPTAPGRYWARVIDINGYPATTDTLVITPYVISNPGIQIAASAIDIDVCTPVVCTATTMDAGANPSFQWQLSGVDVGGDSLVYSNNIFAPGDRVVCIMTADTGCSGNTDVDTSNVITLSVDPLGTATVSISTNRDSICAGSPVLFTATVVNGSSAPVFEWMLNGRPTGDSSSSYNSDSLVNGDILYCLIVSDASCGLAKSNSIPMRVFPLPTVGTQLVTIPYGKTETLEPIITGDIRSYLWTPGAGLSDSTIRTPVADPRYTTVYQLMVVSDDGCPASGVITVDVYTPLSLPAAFTPNGDGRNDILYVLGGPEGSVIKEFSVFNRWGQKVFDAHDGAPGDPRLGWNGYFSGKPAPADVYVYMVVLRLANGRQQSYKGTVLLIR